MAKFLEQHGALVILTLLSLVGLAICVYFGAKLQLEPKEVFAFFTGYTMGVTSALFLAMKSGGSTPPAGGETAT